MSVCASANPFNSRGPATATSAAAGRRPTAAGLTNDERWVALNKNIFQDILNAILIQTTFSSASAAAAAAAGKRHLSPRPEVSLHSASYAPPAAAASPLSFTGTGDASATPNPNGGGCGLFKESKDVVCRAFDSTPHDLVSAKHEALDEIDDGRFSREATAFQGGNSPAGERETFAGHGNGRYSALQEVCEQPLRVSGYSTASGEIGQPGSKGVSSEVVCSSRLGGNMLSAFSRVAPYHMNDSHLSVYCEEAYVGKVPMMIIGLRPYVASSDTKLSCHTDPTNQISLQSNKLLKMRPEEISASSGLDPLDSRNSSSFLLTGGRRAQYDRCAAAKMTERFLPAQPTDQLHINTAAGGVAKNGQTFFRSMYYAEHHSENTHEPSDMSSLKLSPAEVQSNCECAAPPASRQMASKAAAAAAASSAAAGKDFGGRKSSRDHSILTILGLLSSTEDEDDEGRGRQTSGASRSPGGGGPTSEATGLDKSRLLGIGVTVIGRSRWMAVDKCIVYDMIDQVLNGERDYFTTDDSSSSLYSPPVTGTPSRPQVLLSPPMDRRCGGLFSDGLLRRRGHHLPRTQRNCSPVVSRARMNTPSHDTKKKMECGPIKDDLKQPHDMEPLPSSSSSSSSSSSLVSQTITKSSSQEHLSHSKPAATTQGESAAVKDKLLKSLEGVSVLRSLLSDDPIDVCPLGPSATDATTPPQPSLTDVVGDVTEDAKTGDNSVARVAAADFSKTTGAPVDELKRVKRSRHSSVTDGKKRRVNVAMAPGHPSMTNKVLLSDDPSMSGSRSCSVPASVASTMPDHTSSKSANSIKWKSSMLLRMRTEEVVDNEESN